MSKGSFEEVEDKNEANEVIVISKTWGRKILVEKIWFNNIDATEADLMVYAAVNYPYFFGKFVRIDIHPVKFGKIFGKN